MYLTVTVITKGVVTKMASLPYSPISQTFSIRVELQIQVLKTYNCIAIFASFSAMCYRETASTLVESKSQQRQLA